MCRGACACIYLCKLPLPPPLPPLAVVEAAATACAWHAAASANMHAQLANLDITTARRTFAVRKHNRV